MNNIYRKSTVIRTYSLILIEIISMVVAYILAYLIRFHEIKQNEDIQIYVSAGIFMLLATVFYSVITDWNRDFFDRGYFREMLAVLKMAVVVALVGNAYVFAMKTAYAYSRLVFIVFPVLDYTFTYIFHIFFKNYMLNHYKKSVNSDKLMVVTNFDQAEKVIDQILNSNHWNYELTCITVMDRDMCGQEIKGIPVIATADNVINVATQNIMDRVFISLPRNEIETVRDMILEFEAMGMLCHYNMEIPELNLDGKEAGMFAGYSVISFSLQNMDYRRLMIKRAFDIIGSIVGIIITIIVYPFVALAIKIESKGPVIFKQERIGKNGRRFMMYKFRSMYQDAEKRLEDLKDKNEVQGLMFKMEDDPRITKVGRFIRKTSIDELPQFFNILKGDMSLVGTRPPTVAEFEQYNAHYRRRLCITPGLTGMWQVSGRSDIKDFDEVVKLDLKYIDEWSLRLDVKLLLQTVGAVLSHKGSK